jgi:cell wall-associated NlpC family hydrolase
MRVRPYRERADRLTGGASQRPLGIGRGVLVVLGLAATWAPGPARAQGPGVQVGHVFGSGGWTTFRVGWARPFLGPIGFELYGTHLRQSETLGDRLWGGGLDMTVLRGGRQGIYLVGGASGGIAARGSTDFWGSWSAGLGYELVPLDFLSVAGEARWRELSPGARNGIELGLRLGAALGGRRSAPPATPPAVAPGTALTPITPGTVPSTTSPLAQPTAAASGEVPTGASFTLADSVVMAAAAMMGSEYRLGGTGTGGFDCSGLIQYAYGRFGISLPRTSAEQAREGREVSRDLDLLRPGDILTFSNAGGPVTHVGLYVGDHRFMHSATGGVQLSLLSETDPYGRWWYRRWVGVRRIVE